MAFRARLYPIILFFLFCTTGHAQAPPPLPKPDHIVIIIFENHGYRQIFGSPAAPYINELVHDSSAAVFHQSYALQHPSQPNYLDLFAGCNQGVNDNNVPLDTPFVTPNLGRQLIDAGLTFVTYSEDLPSVGFQGATFGSYARKHNPSANWVGTGINQIPPETNQPFLAFPSNNYESLPTISFVIPNQANDMHDGLDPARITTGDAWIKTNLKNYINWAKSNNSLFIITFDEDNSAEQDHIFTLIMGKPVKPGHYYQHIDHYDILRTLEDLYSLPFACHAAEAQSIYTCWKSFDPDPVSNLEKLPVTLFPNPTSGTFQIQLTTNLTILPIEFEIFTLDAKRIYGGKIETPEVSNANEVRLDPGFYIVRLTDGQKTDTRKVIVQ